LQGRGAESEALCFGKPGIELFANIDAVAGVQAGLCGEDMDSTASSCQEDDQVFKIFHQVLALK
jgi:hypothetical protein